MAGRTSRADYATDFYSWSLEQARAARLGAAKETELDETIFPETLVYSFEDIMKRGFVI